MIVLLFFIYLDATLSLLGSWSLMKSDQWIALRTIDFIISLAVFFQSKKLQKMLDEKEQFFLDKGYK